MGTPKTAKIETEKIVAPNISGAYILTILISLGGISGALDFVFEGFQAA